RRRDAGVQSHDVEPQHAAAGGERNAGERQQAVAHRVEQAVEQHHDQQQAERHDDGKPLLRLDQRAELARPFQPIARLERDGFGDARLRLGHGGTEIAAAHAVLDRHEALRVLPVDVGGAGFEPDAGDVAERDIGGRRLWIGIGQRHRHRANGVDIVAVLRGEPHGEREVPFALVDAGDLLAADRGLHHGVHVVDGDAVARRPGAVDLDHEVGLAEQVEGAGVGDARHLGDFGGDLLRQALELVEVGAENLDRVLAFHPRYGFLDIVLDVLREVEVDADELAFQLRGQFLHQPLLGPARRPLIRWLERHEELGDEGAVRIGGVVAAALFGNDGADRRIAQDDLADLIDGGLPGLERDGRRQHAADPEVALLELRQELGAEIGGEHAADEEKAAGNDRGPRRVAHGEDQHPLVERADAPDQEGLDFGELVRQQNRGHDRRHREGRDHGAEQRIGVGARHRPEDLALDALHGEQRQDRRDRDDHREEDGAVDLDRGGEHAVQLVAQPAFAAELVARVMGQMAEDVLHHDDGAVDDDAEVDGADRQEIGGVAAQHRDNDGEKQRHRNGRGNDQRTAQVAEEYPLDEEDEHDAEQHVVQHRVHGHGDEIAAVVERVDLDARRQAAVAVDALDRLAHPRHHVHGALELLHQHDAEQDLALVV